MDPFKHNQDKFESGQFWVYFSMTKIGTLKLSSKKEHAPSTKAGKKIAATMQKPIKTIEKEKTVDPFTKWGNKIEDKINDKIGDISNLSTLKDHFESHFKTEPISNKDEYRSKVKQEVDRNIKTLNYLSDPDTVIAKNIEDAIIIPSVEMLGNVTAKTINQFNKDTSAKQVKEEQYEKVFSAGYKLIKNGVPYLISQIASPIFKDTVGERIKEQAKNLSDMIDVKDSEGQILRQEVVNGIINLVIDKIVFTQSKQSYDDAMDTMGLKTEDSNQPKNKSMFDKLKKTSSFGLTKDEKENALKTLTDPFESLGSWFQ